MHPVRKKRLILILFILSGASIAAALALYALKQNINLYYTPSQVAAGKAPINRLFRMGGLVRKGTIRHEKKGLEIKFNLTDTTQDVEVDYTGVLPDLFREGQGIIVKGKLNREGIFIADQVLAKHSANYMPKPALDAIKAAQKKNKQINN